MTKTKTRVMRESEYEALLYKVLDAGTLIGGGMRTKFAMVDSDFMPTQSMAEARFMAWDNAYDCGLMQVDAVGDAIIIEREW